MTSVTASQIVQALGQHGIASTRVQPLPSAHPKCADGVIAFGLGQPALELAILPMRKRLTAAETRDVWAARQAGRPNPLVLLLITGIGEDDSGIWVGVDAASLAVVELDWGQAVSLASAALKEPNGAAAVRYLEHSVPRPGENAIPGLNNLGMFANHTLTELAPHYPEWAGCARRGAELVGLRGRALLEGLGFQIEAQPGSAVELLRDASDRAAAVAVFLDQGEAADTPLPRLGGDTPVSAALARAERENLRFVFLARSDKLRVHVTGNVHGVGRKGPAETLIEVDMPLLHRDQRAYVPLIFGAKAIADGGTFERILSESRDYSVKLSERLRDRIYVDVVPSLAVSVAQANKEDALDDVYEQSLVLLFRLLFVAYAEDRDLLPYRRNDRYRNASLKALARELADLVEEGKDHAGDDTTSLWARVNALFEAVDKGAQAWDVPAYNGGLFSTDEAVNEPGASLAAISLTNEQLGHALTVLLVEPGNSDLPTAPVDFRSLSVRDFGTIYEGLLESGISEAPEDLALDNAGNYVPAGAREPVVLAGDIYHHNRGGARKSTGSYFTKDFAVEHLLDKALVPSVDAHLDRVVALLDRGDDEAAATAFLDFRCVDLAMGSGHFLVAAVDKIEERFSRFLDEHPIKGVVAELDSLRAAALRGLGDSADLYEIERRALLRRQIARRCVYGVDVNRIAVELAQLALWVHTFVPGLALAYLGHNLVWGNALTGIGTLEEAADALDGSRDGGTISIFLEPIRELLAATAAPLERLAKANDATRDNMQVVYDAQREAEAAASSARALFDLICAQRRGETTGVETTITREALEGHAGLERARDASHQLQALHFPVAFPEVFLRGGAGFDCILGNPPWDKLMPEPQQFWVTREPGLNALAQTARVRRIAELRIERSGDAEAERQDMQFRELVRGHVEASYDLQGGGHHDLAKVFLERALRLSAGSIGLVLPRQALVLRGWSALRAALMDRGGLRVVQARNDRGWMFDDVEPRYMVVLIDSGALPPEAPVAVIPVVKGSDDLHRTESTDGIPLTRDVIRSLSDTAAIPWLDSMRAAETFELMRQQPSLASGSGWATGTHDARYDFRGSATHARYAAPWESGAEWSIYMTRHLDAYAVDLGNAFSKQVADIAALAARVPSGFEQEADEGFVLSASHPLIVVRHPSRNDDSRTLIASALPRRGQLHQKGYVHAVAHAADTPELHRLALLGYVNSTTADWWARRFVDRHVTAPVINALRLPAWSTSQIERAGQLAASTLKANGYVILAGGIVVDDYTVEVENPLAELDVLAAMGFGLSGQQFSALLDDFSLGTLSADARETRLRYWT